VTAAAKRVAIDRERASRRHGVGARGAHDQRPERLQLALEQPRGWWDRRCASEFEHTSSASRSVRVDRSGAAGRISHSTTRRPRLASCQAHSQPASPPPTT
jgi:hypothetical protein